MYELLTRPVDMMHLPSMSRVEYVKIMNTFLEDGFTHFVHGVSIELFKERLFIIWGDNKASGKEENTITEDARFRASSDGGLTWGRLSSIKPPSAPFAISHGCLCAVNGTLLFFAPHFMGKGVPIPHSIHFLDLFMELYEYQEHKDAWVCHGKIADDFWPYTEPIKMDNGNWIIAGQDHNWLGAIAISRGDDMLHWDVIKMDVQGHIFTEATLWNKGSRIVVVMRNQTMLSDDGYFHAAVSTSDDYGLHFTPSTPSNMPMGTSKPYCFRFGEDRPGIVFTHSTSGKTDRGRLLFGMGEPGSLSIDQLFTLQDWGCNLSYPYAKQIGSYLFVAYSQQDRKIDGHNQNDLMLAKIPLPGNE